MGLQHSRRTRRFAPIVLALAASMVLGGFNSAQAAAGSGNGTTGTGSEAPAAPDVVVARPDKHTPHMPHGKGQPSIEEDESGESGADGGSGDYVLYRGGWIQESPKIYLVLWGNWTTANDTYNVQNRLPSSYTGSGGSAYADVLKGYGYNCTFGGMSCPSGVMFKNPASQFMNWWKDTSTVPTTPTDAQMKAEAARAAAHFGDYSHNAQYVIALPPGHGDVGFKAGNYCAYHWWASTPTAAVSYTMLPYMPDAGRGCYNYTFGSALDGLTIVASHEYTESVTDPFVSAGDRYEGWDDSTRNAGEVGDKCAGGGTTYNAKTTLSTGTFPVQAIWSNYARYYKGWGCVFHN
jgi:serine protease